MNFAVNSNVRSRKLPGPAASSLMSPLENSSIARLRYREVFGICKKGKRSVSSSKHLFSVLPRRFAFPLTSLVDEVTLHEDGHVFLGFSSCDRFLISYTVRIEEARHTGFLSHIYTLHWWLWSPGVKAKKVGSVRLFANEEIEYSLFLCYAEWPNLKSQIIVYGYRKCCESCYITIAAVPPLMPCMECSTATLVSCPEGEGTSEAKGDLRCNEHSFAMHFKQASGTSQTGILNSSGLKIDGIMILNIGHSIAVLSTGYLPENSNLDCLPLSSIKRKDCEDTMAEVESDVSDTLERDFFRDQISVGHEFDAHSENATSKSSNQKLNGNIIPLLKLGANSQGSADSEDKGMQSPHLKLTQSTSVYDDIDNEHDSCERISLNQKSNVADKENSVSCTPTAELKFECSVNVDPYFDPEPKSIVLRKGVKDPNSSSAISSDAKRMTLTESKLGLNCQSLFQENAAASAGDCAKLCNYSQYQGDVHPSFSDVGGEKIYLSEFRCVIRNKSPFLSPLLNSSVLNERQNSSEATRSDLNFVTPSPTASDGSSSVPFSNESNILSSSVRHSSPDRNGDGLVSFSENFYGSICLENISSEDPLPVGETSLHYCSMLCHGAGGEILHPLEKGSASIQAFSQHLVLDLEHVIFDILRTRCYIAYKYGYLVDYEANVMDVCSTTRSVIVHVVALLSVQRHRSKCLPVGVAADAVMRQAEFILSWSLLTGRYEVVVARPMVSYDERKSGEWKGDWIVKLDSAIKQQCAIRSDPYKSVYILDNSAVLRGRSLNVLWNCDRTIALTR